jgi:putative phage-type endonuclease
MNDIERQAWLEARRAGIGGSDCAAALGLSPWKTPYQLWQEKRGLAVDQPDNWAMRWGRTMEAELRQHYSDVTGRAVLVPTDMLRHPRHEWMVANVDGGTEDKRIVEIKTSRSADGWGEPGTDQIPQHYLLQVQHYLCVTAYPVADVVLGIYGREPAIYEVPADAELQQMIVDGEAEFWRAVTEGDPPEPTSYADVVARWGRRSVANAVIADTDLRARVMLLGQIRKSIADAQSIEEEHKAAVMKALGEFDTLIDESGNVLCTWKASKPALRFDARAFQAAHADLYQQFLKTGESSRRFLLKG